MRERRAARNRGAVARAVRWRVVAAWGVGLSLAAFLATGLVFAGSADRIAAGVTVAGVKVGGLTTVEAERLLAERARRYASVPVVFTAGAARFALRPSELEARVDWAAVAEEARTKGDWPLPLRGVRRVAVRLFGADVEPRADVYDARLAYELDRMARELARPARNAAIVLDELEPTVIPDREGRTLDRTAAKARIVTALAGFERRPVPLPVRVGPPAVRAEELEPLVEQVQTALSAPVRFGWRDAHWLVQPQELAELLELPAGGRSELRIAGRKADRYFALLSRAVNRRPRDADFAATADGRVRVLPSRVGRRLDVEATERALLAGALSVDRREAELVVRTVEPRLTTERARAMKVTRVLASFTTAYAGTYDRIRNLRLAVGLIDGTRLSPGETFSFNEIVGPRTSERGFRAAPVIVDGAYEEGVGGGVSQVATTVFNAAWEAGLKITARTAHALYISRYPLGRDATVNFPDVDLKFVNDTDGWIVVKATAGDAGIAISLLGAPTGRRVVSRPGAVEETRPPEVEQVPDPTLFVGETAVVDDGEPAREITVERIVYEGGRVLYEERWYTSYRSEPKIVRVGTIPLPQREPERPPATPKKRDEPKDEPGTTAPTGTAPAPTTPTATTTTPGG